MKLTIRFTAYDKDEFTLDELSTIELFITNLLKDHERQIGVSFLLKGVIFQITSIGYDVEANTKLIFISQITTKKKSIIEKPGLIIPKGN